MYHHCGYGNSAANNSINAGNRVGRKTSVTRLRKSDSFGGGGGSSGGSCINTSNPYYRSTIISSSSGGHISPTPTKKCLSPPKSRGGNATDSHASTVYSYSSSSSTIQNHSRPSTRVECTNSTTIRRRPPSFVLHS